MGNRRHRTIWERNRRNRNWIQREPKWNWSSFIVEDTIWSLQWKEKVVDLKTMRLSIVWSKRFDHYNRERCRSAHFLSCITPNIQSTNSSFLRWNIWIRSGNRIVGWMRSIRMDLWLNRTSNIRCNESDGIYILNYIHCSLWSSMFFEWIIIALCRWMSPSEVFQCALRICCVHRRGLVMMTSWEW